MLQGDTVLVSYSSRETFEGAAPLLFFSASEGTVGNFYLAM
jgi:hypothetical protein